MFSDPQSDYTPYMLIALAVVISVVLAYWMWRSERLSEVFAIGLIIGGAMGNVVDRIRLGAVADFVDIHVLGYHWPAFNVADSAIFIGVFWLLIDGFVHKPAKT